MSKCKDCILEDCTLKVFKNNNKCILHCKKDDWYTGDNDKLDWSISKDNIKDFWIKIQNIVETKYKQITGYQTFDYSIKFNKVIFPKFQDNKEYYHSEVPAVTSTNFYFNERKINGGWIEESDAKSIEESDKQIEECVNKWIEENSLSFYNCTFLCIADFEKYNFKESIEFDDCHFKKELKLNGKYKSKLIISNSKFYHQNLNLGGIIFEGEFRFIKNKDINMLNSKHTNYCLVSFRDTTFKKVNFQYAIFNSMTSFSNTTFLEDIDFKFALFNDVVFFNEVIFEKQLDLEKTTFKDEANFLYIKGKDDKLLSSNNLANRETARKIKYCLEKQNNIIEANKFYALEMEKQEKELEWKNSFINKLIFTVHKVSSNHSQDVVLPLFWIISITFIVTILQFLPSIEENIYLLIFICFSMIVIILAEGLLVYEIEQKYKPLLALIFSIVNYFIYLFLIGDESLCYFSNTLNPFSKDMADNLTLSTLAYKITIAYLSYQFIVSIRQNTRRK